MKREDLQSMKYVELYLVADYSEVRGQPWSSAEKPLLSLHAALPRCGRVHFFFSSLLCQLDLKSGQGLFQPL